MMHRVYTVLLKVIPFFVIGLITAIIPFFLPSNHLDLYVFNADFLYLPSLYQSVIEEGKPIWDWYLTPAPYFFPDFFIYAIIQAFVHNFRLSLSLANGFTFSFIFFLLYVLFRKLTNQQFKMAFFWVSTLFILVIWINALTGHYLLMSFIFTISNHAGNIINTLLASILAIQIIQSNRYHIFLWVLYFLFSVICLISDNLFFLTFIFPLTLFLIVLLTLKFSGQKLFFFLLHGSSVTIGLVLSNNLRFFAYHVNKVKTRWDRMPESIDYFIKTSSFLYRSYTPFVILLILVLVYFIYFIIKKRFYLRLQVYQWHNLFFVFIFLSAVTSVVMAVVGGYHWDLDTSRYYMAAVYIFLLIGLIHFFAVLIHQIWVKVVLSFTVLFYGIFMFYKSEPIHFTRLDKYTPQHIAEIIQIADSLDLKDGITDYWAAKPIYVFSQGRHVMAAMYDKMFYPYHHISYIGWAWGPVFSFAYLPDYAPVNTAIMDSITISSVPINIGGHFYITRPFRLEKEKKEPILLE